MVKRFTKLRIYFLCLVLVFGFGIEFSNLFSNRLSAATFAKFSIKPSRVEASITDVNFLIKVEPTTADTEDEVTVTFDAGYTVDSTASNITVSTSGILDWDSECANAWPGIGSQATGVSSQAVTFASSDLTVGQVYCFIITGGVDNPASLGNYVISVETFDTSASVDMGIMSLPIIDDDSVVITASVAPFVRCDVGTTNGFSDNAIDLGVLRYGTVTSSTEDIRIGLGTNTVSGAEVSYTSENGGLSSILGSYTLTGADAEDTLSATTLSCSGTDPCFGIYASGVSSASTGSIAANTNFTGLTATTAVGPITTDAYGVPIASSTGALSNGVIEYNVNATASEEAPAAVDYTDTLTFTCKANL
ncbi:hypothetical protein IH575_01340 [Candidatus Dojkabacteria bacterium]|nr:hypothetical protein [Candidatus Dojkabacteria bacterium]